MKRIFLFILLGFGTAVPLFGQISLAPGVRMPDIEAEWINAPKKRPSLSENEVNRKKRITVMTMTDALSPDFIQTLRMLESIDSKLRHEKRVEIESSVVTKNNTATLKRVLEAAGSPFVLVLGADDQERTYKSYGAAVTTLPHTFVAVDGALIWSGHPIELENILEENINGTYSASKQAQISNYRKQMQSALRAGLPGVAAQTADRILTLAPADSIALQTKLYAYEMTGKRADAVQFLRTHLEKNPKYAMTLRMLLLDALLRNGEIESWRKEVSNALPDAMKKPDTALNLAAYVIDNAPYAALPIREVFLLTDKSLEDFSKDPSMKDLYADALEIRARADYKACRLESAIAEQQKAVALRRQIKSPFLDRAEKVLVFYQSLRQGK